jgi:hypothetical protein
MTSTTTKPESLQPAADMVGDLFDNWFDPLEAEVRARSREFIEELLRAELDAALSRPRYGRSPVSGSEGRASIAPLPAAWRRRENDCSPHAPAAEPMAQSAHHQCHRAAARGVQAKDQNPNRAAVSRHRCHVVLGAARLRSDQHAQGRGS